MERAVKIQNELGVHARPAAVFVKLANKFDSNIFISKNGIQANGKSIMGILMLAAECGSTVLIRAEGDDSSEAVDKLALLIESKFEDHIQNPKSQIRNQKCKRY